MIIKCKDGELQVPEMLINYNPGARKFCNDKSKLEWAKNKNMSEVFEELNNMPWA